MDNVEWKDIEGYEGVYQVSNTGEVKSLERKTIYKDGRTGIHKERIRKQQINHKGYKVIDLTRFEKQKSCSVHRLVALAFIPNPENKEQVNHKDGNKLNNHVENLEWVTNDENGIHANENSLRPESKRPKSVHQYTLEGEYVATHRSIYQAAKSLGSVSPGLRTHIALTCKGVRPTCRGYLWKFA